MTDAQKILTLQVLLEDGGEVPDAGKLNAYLDVAKGEILSWMYHLVGGVPASVTEVPERYEGTQIYAVVAGYTHAGAEGQRMHIENGTHRTFIYSDMLDYIHNNVLPIVRVGALK